MSAPLSVKLTCRSWQQLSAIHSRDLSRGAFFLKTKKPPPIGTAVRISLTLPSGSSIELNGAIHKLIGEGELGGRGPGIDIALKSLPQSVMWLIESALSSAGITPRPLPDTSEKTPPPAASAPEPEAPDLGDGDEVVQAEADLVKALWQELSSMSKMNAFQLLGVEYDAADADVRRAFGELSKRYHPDRFTRYESFEIRELAGEVFILLRDAYRKIADAEGRQKQLAKLDPSRNAAPSQGRVATPPPSPGARRTPPPIPPARTPPPPTPPVRTPPPPAAAPVRTPPPPVPTPPPPSEPVRTPPPGTQAYSSPTAASPVSVAATTPAPSRRAQTSPGEEGANRVAMGMNVLESGQYEQALRILRVEARKDPNNLTARAGVELAEGRLALANGDRMEAAERFEAALDIDPSNERAAREIAEMRRYATSQRRGLLSKLMKKV